jgi:ferredoxin
MNMVKYKILHIRNECIGCGACAAIDEDNWFMSEDGKATLNKSKEVKKGIYELIVDEKEIELFKESSECCPVAIIKVEKIEE